jgi:ribosomal protein L30/L7E
MKHCFQLRQTKQSILKISSWQNMMRDNIKTLDILRLHHYQDGVMLESQTKIKQDAVRP